jgi:hypothetical protein
VIILEEPSVLLLVGTWNRPATTPGLFWLCTYANRFLLGFIRSFLNSQIGLGMQIRYVSSKSE